LAHAKAKSVTIRKSYITEDRSLSKVLNKDIRYREYQQETFENEEQNMCRCCDLCHPIPLYRSGPGPGRDRERRARDNNYQCLLRGSKPERENLNEEWIEISNQGESDENLAGWTLEDRQNHTYTFPDFILVAGASARIHTGVGSDTSEDLYWNRNTAVWNNDGDTATLKDASGDIVYRYPENAKEA